MSDQQPPTGKCLVCGVPATHALRVVSGVSLLFCEKCVQGATSKEQLAKKPWLAEAVVVKLEPRR